MAPDPAPAPQVPTAAAAVDTTPAAAGGTADPTADGAGSQSRGAGLSGTSARSQASGSGSVRWYRLSAAGATCAALFAAASLTPSLLPRSASVQAVVTGVAAALGYSAGVGGVWLLRRITGRPGPASRRVRGVLALLAGVLLAVMLVLDKGWQDQLHGYVGQPAAGWSWFPLVVGIAALVLAGLVGLARLIRRLARGAAGVLARCAPSRPTRLAAVALVLLGMFAVLRWELGGPYAVADRAFAVRDRGTSAGVVQPASPVVSGSARSAIGWSELGRDGRSFISAVATTDQLESFSGRPARQPIRVYAGIASAVDPRSRAELAVADLKRFGAFERKVLLVANSTGSGTVDQGGVAPLEYLYDGDSAMVSMQYSHLPSWLSFLADEQVARSAGRELFAAVYREWSQLPAATRPKLLVFGESLGSFSGEAAFDGIAELTGRTDGVLFVGPPNANPLHTRFTAQRDAGTPEVLPVFQGGRNLRFAQVPADLARPATTWESPRLVYLQNASDPVVWWSPDLLLAKPDWLREPRGAGVSPALQWLPLLTFFQLSADMVDSTGVPYGHGHVYGPTQAAAWARIAPPKGWTPADTARLVALMGGADTR